MLSKSLAKLRSQYLMIRIQGFAIVTKMEQVNSISNDGFRAKRFDQHFKTTTLSKIMSGAQEASEATISGLTSVTFVKDIINSTRNGQNHHDCHFHKLFANKISGVTRF